MIKGAALSLGPAMARGHSLRATRGVGPAVPPAAFPPLLPWGAPLAPHGFCHPGDAALHGCWSKIGPWVKKTFAKRRHSPVPLKLARNRAWAWAGTLLPPHPASPLTAVFHLYPVGVTSHPLPRRPARAPREPAVAATSTPAPDPGEAHKLWL